jgi:group I intron endonuclease
MIRKQITIGVYTIQNTASDGIYIGSSGGKGGIHARWDEHRSLLRGNRHTNPPLQMAWNKYGEPAFDFKIVESVLFAEYIYECEQHWIDHYRDQGLKIYNILPTAGSRLGTKTSDETKRKLSEVFKGRFVSAETIRRRCIARSAIYAFIAPDGTEYRDIINLKAFADQHGLNHSAIRNVWAGILNYHKGWLKLGSTYKFTYYILTHKDTGETVRLREGTLSAFCRERGISDGNLFKTMDAKYQLNYTNGWSMQREETP